MKKRIVKPGAAKAPGDGEFSLIPPQKLLDLYAAMLKCRMIAKVVGKGKGGARGAARHFSCAVTAGVTIDLGPSDALCPTFSDVSPCAVKGVSIKTLLRWWAHPTARLPREVALANVISPAGSLEARYEAALRLAADYRSSNSRAAVAFFAESGVGRTKAGSNRQLASEMLESFLLQAVARRLPILFVVDGARDASDYVGIYEKCGVPGMVVDKDDAVAVYRSASEALVHARRGNGPTLIDSRPWVPNRQKSKAREPKDSIDKMEAYLAGKGLVYRPVKARIAREFTAEFEF